MVKLWEQEVEYTYFVVAPVGSFTSVVLATATALINDEVCVESVSGQERLQVFDIHQFVPARLIVVSETIVVTNLG